MNTKTKKVLKWVVIIFGLIILLAVCFGLYVNSIIPKFDSKPVVLQQEIFTKPSQAFPMEGKYIYLSATRLASMIRSGQATSLEVVTEHLNHIKNDNFQYNALIFVREAEALAEAKLADVAVARGDTVGKPLLGVPISIKEMFWVKGSPCTMNAKMFGFTAPRDAEVVTQLKNAGAIVLGTTNDAFMLADYQTQGEVYPTCNNPFDTTRTPGGSTGGGAAAVAAGFSAMELGSDMGGSIRLPAVFCGLWSLKPTFGTVNITQGTGPDTTTKFTRMAMASGGPLARSPEDLQLMWDVISKTKLDSRFQKPVEWKPASSKTLDQYKIAWMDEWKAKDGNVKVSEGTRQKLHTFLDSLTQHRVALEKDAPDIYTDLQRMFLRSFASMMGENQPWLLRKFMEIDFSKTDDGSGNFEVFSKTIMDASDKDWEQIQSDRKALIEQWETFFSKYDFFICPVAYDAAFTKQESWKPIKADDGTTMPYMKYVPYTYILNASGHPAITVPLGLNDKGLPIGVQIVGPNYSEPELLHLGMLLKSIVPGFQLTDGE